MNKLQILESQKQKMKDKECETLEDYERKQISLQILDRAIKNLNTKIGD